MSKQTLVYLSDSNYLPATIASIQSARETGLWQDEIVLILDQAHELCDQQQSALKHQQCQILVRPRIDIGDNTLPIAFLKNTIFTHPLFRNYDRVHFFDSDTLVVQDLNSTLGKLNPSRPDSWCAFRDNPGKGDLHSSEFTHDSAVRLGITNRPDPFATCLFSVFIDQLPRATEMTRVLSSAWQRYGHAAKYQDQSIYNIVFAENFECLPWTTEMRPTAARLAQLDFPPETLALHCGHRLLFSKPGSPFHIEFLNYARRAGISV